MSYSAVGLEFAVNESTIYIHSYIYGSLNRNTHKTRLYIDQLTKILGTEAHRNLNLFPLRAVV